MLVLRVCNINIIADNFFAKLNFVGLFVGLAPRQARQKSLTWCQVEVTVLEVEMADDCVSTSALRCF